MKTADLLRMCRENLSRRRARTFLSVLGVIIGCCSILLMMSIGVGLNNSNQSMLEDMGDLRKIEVWSMYENGAETAKLDTQAVRTFKQIEHVQTVIPQYGFGNMMLSVTYGNNQRYKTNGVTIVGYDAQVLAELGYELTEGALPERNNTAIMGQYFEYSFMDMRRPEGRNMVSIYEYLYGGDGNDTELPDPYTELINKDVTLQIMDETEKVVYTEDLHISGKIKENYGVGYETSDGLILQASDMERIYKNAAKALGLKKSELTINSISVLADGIETVTQVEEAIKELGYGTSSMQSMRESTQQEMAIVELVLGGIGAVSLLVAAIGIINTMIMSVSERTKEIGIMKAIGCYVRDIRKLFLMESAAIGLIGGVIGSIISFVVSCIINLVAGNRLTDYSEETYTVFQMMFTSPNRISVIPWWLLLFGLSFSALIGLAAGFYPADKAVKISALEAMHNE